MCGWLEKMGIQIGHLSYLSKCNIWNIHGTFKTEQSVPTSTNSFQRLSELSDWQNSDINVAMYPSYIHPESLRCQGHRNAKEARRLTEQPGPLSFLTRLAAFQAAQAIFLQITGRAHGPSVAISSRHISSLGFFHLKVSARSETGARMDWHSFITHLQRFAL